ncbi:MAG: hypothetical protein Q8R95_00445, partial [Azonexus sp.]|nr:hypothetical protein [Azonexus sp.]
GQQPLPRERENEPQWKKIPSGRSWPIAGVRQVTCKLAMAKSRRMTVSEGAMRRTLFLVHHVKSSWDGVALPDKEGVIAPEVHVGETRKL